jgi:hypothetical protein
MGKHGGGMLAQHSLSVADDRSVGVSLDSEILIRLGQAAATRRLELGLSCSEVAMSIGETKEILAAFESGYVGANSVRIEFVLRLAKALKMPARDLFLTFNN